MKTVLITGATSFIGVNLIRRLLEDGYEIYAIVRSQSQKVKLLPVSANLHIIEASMEAYSMLDQLIARPCDGFVHLAWNGTRGADRMNEAMQRQNYCFSMEAVKAALRLSCPVVVTAGSQAEYGVCKGPITETTDCNPNTEYGKWKLKFYEDASLLCQQNRSRLLEPRFFSLYGPDDFAGTMVISILKKMLKNEDCPLTACSQMWDFLYISDAVNGMEKLLESESAFGVYNFGSGIAKPLKEYVEEMARLTDTGSRLLYGTVPYGPAGVVSIEPVVHKLKEATDWSPVVSFEQGILNIFKVIRSSEKRS